jgi:omega-amidase
MKVAVAQIACAPGELETNLCKLEVFAARAQAAGAELVVFPEMADTGYVLPIIRETARPWSEGALPRLKEMARHLRLAIICGISERVGTAIYNSQAFIDAKGEVAGTYRKSHLFCAGSFDEKECFTPGEDLSSFDFAGFRLGLSICYDLRFPEVYRELAANQQANVLIVSSAWPFPRLEHLRILSQARAIENQSYLILANRVGTDNNVTFCGNSAVINPMGEVITRASAEDEELVIAEVTNEKLSEVRKRMAVFAHRRPGLYRALSRE